jgi:5-methylcytosine-specific restriction endonuclease McrA
MPLKPSHHKPQRLAGARSHAAEVYEKTRRIGDLEVAARLRNSHRWARVRRAILAERPLCSDPFGWHAADDVAVLAAEVDHVQPLRTHPHLAFTHGNLAALCLRCHAMKSAGERRERRRFSRP